MFKSLSPGDGSLISFRPAEVPGAALDGEEPLVLWVDMGGL